MTNLEEQLQAERRKVDVSATSFSVRELVRMMVEGELNFAPAYQRKFRWKQQDESVFIESIFLGLPIPPIFVATNTGFQWEVVDGLQRLSTLLHFIGNNSEDLMRIDKRSPLRIEGLSKVTDLNGKFFTDVPRALQIYFGRQPLQVISLTDKSDLEVRFDLFERLNAGALRLSAQEVRACVFRGPFNDFIEELSEWHEFRSLLKLSETKQKDGTYAEQVLKYFAYKYNGENFDGKVEFFLNDFMENVYRRHEMGGLRADFERAVGLLSEALEGRELLRSNHPVTPLVQFEACLVAAGKLGDEGITRLAPPANWLDDEDLKKQSMGGTNSRASLNRRVSRAEALLRGSA